MVCAAWGVECGRVGVCWDDVRVVLWEQEAEWEAEEGQEGYEWRQEGNSGYVEKMNHY